MQAPKDNRSKSHWWRSLAVGAVCALLIGCGATVNQHGYKLDPEELAEITPGVATRQDVLDVMGSPSTISTFQDSKWYYIGQRTEEFAFFKPDVLERSVLVVSFDDSGLVEGTQVYTLEDGQEIDLVSRETPTEGRDLSLLQELFGNLGRFEGGGAGVPTPFPGQ